METGSVSEEAFRRACAKFATGVAVATTCDAEGVPHGITVNSFTSVSLEPPLVLICIDYRSVALPHFREARSYGINVLSLAQRELSNRFAQRSEPRFDGVEWHAGLSGIPLLDGALAHFECELGQVVEAGDHAVLIAEVVHASSIDGEPLLYFASGYVRLR